MFAREQIPNLLTFGRVAAVPAALLLIVFAPMQQWALFVIFAAASVTDYYDGMLARKWNVASRLGAFLDPVADKLLVALMLIYCVPYFGLSLVAVAIIILREIYISALREFLAAKQVQLPVSKGGKWKTATQMAGLSLILFTSVLDWPAFLVIGKALVWVSAALAFISAVDYTRKSWPNLR